MSNVRLVVQKGRDPASGATTSAPGSSSPRARGSGVARPVSAFAAGVPAAAPGSAETSSTFAGALPVTVTGCGANSSRWKVRVSGSKTAKRIAGVICLPGRRGTKV